MPCGLESQPHQCFAKYQHSHLQKRNRHSWESIGECDGCKFARINAEIAFVPEEDIDFSDMRWARIDPKDFTEPTPRVETRGSKAREVCPKGHNEWGVRKSGERFCKFCNRLRVNRQRNGGYRKTA